MNKLLAKVLVSTALISTAASSHAGASKIETNFIGPVESRSQSVRLAMQDVSVLHADPREFSKPSQMLTAQSTLAERGAVASLMAQLSSMGWTTVGSNTIRVVASKAFLIKIRNVLTELFADYMTDYVISEIILENMNPEDISQISSLMLVVETVEVLDMIHDATKNPAAFKEALLYATCQHSLRKRGKACSIEHNPYAQQPSTGTPANPGPPNPDPINPGPPEPDPINPGPPEPDPINPGPPEPDPINPGPPEPDPINPGPPEPDPINPGPPEPDPINPGPNCPSKAVGALSILSTNSSWNCFVDEEGKKRLRKFLEGEKPPYMPLDRFDNFKKSVKILSGNPKITLQLLSQEQLDDLLRKYPEGLKSKSNKRGVMISTLKTDGLRVGGEDISVNTKALSGKDNDYSSEGFLPPRPAEEGNLKVTLVPNPANPKNKRQPFHDAELTNLEHLVDIILSKNPIADENGRYRGVVGTVYIDSNAIPCSSCANAIKEFSNLFPEVNIVVAFGPHVTAASSHKFRP